MKERLGILIVISGVILMSTPSLDVEELLIQIQMLLVKYWPIGMIAIGLLMANPKKKKSRSKQR